MTRKTSVFLADDHPIFRAGLRTLIEADHDLEIVGEAATGTAALALICELRPNVAVVDITMPGLNGIVLTKRLAEKCPSLRVLLLTLHEDRAYVNQALQVGAAGYLLKRSAAENLTEAIRTVHAGGLYKDPAIAEPSVRSSGRLSALHVDEPAVGALTGREAEVLRLTAFGETNKEIARRLGVSVKTVETFKARAAVKIGLRTRAEIVRYAAAEGWLANL